MLARLMDDEDLAHTVIQGFIQDIPLESALRGYLVTEDGEKAQRQAHTIKGASANVGGEALRAAAFEMEKTKPETSMPSGPAWAIWKRSSSS